MAAPGTSASTKRMFAVSEGAKLHIAMTIFQFGYAGNHVIMRAALNMGVSKLVFPIYRNIIALVLLVPFAYFIERYVVRLYTSMLFWDAWIISDPPRFLIRLQFLFLVYVGKTGQH